ncbi:CerR family C-terminal domain-containing protein [Rhodoferax saidenbachensis]|uniref:AcrR family transcriptional regulator n=1 Tax=Rhodoferax saidenbachensis TaxID=1484693 RepID=A0ABU1ZLT3_9BURK|nr:CerR family C-terminal domain-containing protein [Rhodoferax saidenbachensis]MDR7306502.1 AcrR family transcriptional regulator [Rhodoferax saidenbachensis]
MPTPAVPLPLPLAPAAAKHLRSDGQEARTRLLDAALVLFADRGFAKTSTREIALAANVNVASISYYFGDKAGLYRAVFTDPRSNPSVEPSSINHPEQTLADSLRAMLDTFTEPMKNGVAMQNCMKLHIREMLEPTGLWQAEIDDRIKPAHNALVQTLCRHLGVTQPDDDVHRLAFSIVGLGMILHVGSDVIQAIRPELIGSPTAIDAYAEHMLGAALSMVEGEVRRRQALSSAPATP